MVELLIDENLSPRLADDLADLFPGSIHANSDHLGSTQDQVFVGIRPRAWLRTPNQRQGFHKSEPWAGRSSEEGKLFNFPIERTIGGNAFEIFFVRKDYRRSLLILKLRLTVTPQPPSSETSADRESVLPFRTRICARPRACALRARRCSGLSARA